MRHLLLLLSLLLLSMMKLITGFTCPPTIYFKFITSATAFFITKCDGLLLQSATAFLLQSALSVITKCDRYYKVWQFHYKVRQVLQSATIITKCDSTHGCSTEILDTVVKSSSSSSPISQAFCSYLYYFAEEIVEALCSKTAWYFYTDISAGSNGNFRGKTKRIFDCRVCSFWKIVHVSDTKFVQFVQNQNIVKLTWCSRPKIKMLKYSGEVSIIFL